MIRLSVNCKPPFPWACSFWPGNQEKSLTWRLQSVSWVWSESKCNEYATNMPPIYLHLIFDILQFEISSLMNWIFFLVWTGFLQATQAVKIQFKLGKKSTLSTQNFKLENVKNQVQIDRGLGKIQFNIYIEVFFV